MVGKNGASHYKIALSSVFKWKKTSLSRANAEKVQGMRIAQTLPPAFSFKVETRDKGFQIVLMGLLHLIGDNTGPDT